MLVCRIFHAYGDGSLFCFSISHLTRYGTFPDEVVQAALLCIAFYLVVGDVSGSNGLVGFLRSFSVGMELSWLGVCLAVHGDDFVFCGVDAEGGEVDGVGTHVCDES